jgi:hypothetical protein
MRFIEGALTKQLKERGWTSITVPDEPDVFLLKHPNVADELVIDTKELDLFGQFLYDLLYSQFSTEGVPLEIALLQEFKRVYQPKP